MHIICKLLEWCSRPIAKGEPYARKDSNEKWRRTLLDGYNKFGNAVDHELTIKFIESGYDLELLYPQKGDAYEGE